MCTAKRYGHLKDVRVPPPLENGLEGRYWL